MNKLVNGVTYILALAFAYTVWWIEWPFQKRTSYTTTMHNLVQLPGMGYGTKKILEHLKKICNPDMEVHVSSRPSWHWECYVWTFRYGDTTVTTEE